MAERVYCLYRGKDQESILMQKNACHDFAEKKGWNIVDEEQEIGVSGYDDVYHAVREGYAAGWYPDGTGRWDESVDTGDVYGQLASTLGLENTGSGYQKISNGNVEYTISGLSVELSNNALSSGQSKGYTAAVEIRLEVPVRFLGNLLPAAEMMLHTEAKYVPVF